MPTYTLNATHLHIAARMQTLLEAWLGEPFDVARLLADEHEQREVLFVCQASSQPELIELARQFVAAGRPMPAIPRAAPAPLSASRRDRLGADAHRPAAPRRGAASAPQDAAWSRDSSGFGVTDLPFTDASGLGASPVARTPQSPRPLAGRPRWLQRPKWLRRELRGS